MLCYVMLSYIMLCYVYSRMKEYVATMAQEATSLGFWRDVVAELVLEGWRHVAPARVRRLLDD